MDENYLKTLRILELEPSLSQRVLAQKLNLSLGKANYMLNSMIDEGFVRAVRFKNSSNKRAYMYYLTPEGLRQKMELALKFLQVKYKEFEVLQREIELLRKEVLVSGSSLESESGLSHIPLD